MVGNEGKSRYTLYDLYTRSGFDPDRDMACPDGCITGGGQLSVAGTDQILASAADGRAAGLGRAE